MDILTETEIAAIVKNSKIAAEYNKVVDNKSAYEILTEKITTAQKRSTEIVQDEEAAAEETKKVKQEKTLLENPIVKSGMRYFFNYGIRTIFSILLKEKSKK